MIGNETSSRNNEVVHAGFLYPPDSLRGRFCRSGAEILGSYCRERDIDISVWGKLVLALNDDEAALLSTFLGLGEACGVDDLELMTPSELRGLEPDITCRAALYSPSTAVVDSHTLMLSLLGDAENAGTVLALNSQVLGGQITDTSTTLVVKNADGTEFNLQCSYLVNAAGLGAHQIASQLSGTRAIKLPDIYYAKGSFFSLGGKPPFSHIIVPLGATLAAGGAFTLDPGGQGKFGPDLEWVDNRDYSVEPTKASVFASAVGRYWDGLDVEKLQPGYAGIRPRTYGPNDPQGDWIIETEKDHGVPGLVNLLGIETPGLTASMSVAGYVAEALVH